MGEVSVLKDFLRTLRGQATLFGVTALLAVGLAAFLSTQTAFFARYVQEKPPEASMEDGRVAELLETGPQELTNERREGIYSLWLAGTDPSPTAVEHLGRTWFLARAERTLLAGTVAQRRRAVVLLHLGAPEDADAVVERARIQVRRVGPDEAIAALEE